MFWIGFLVGAGFGVVMLGVISCAMISRDEKELMEEFKNE